MKSVRRFTMDASIPMRRTVHDEVLVANSPGKVLAPGELWDGRIKSKIDLNVGESPPIKGFTLGHVVEAGSPGQVLDLGKLFRGALDLRSDLLLGNEMATRDAEKEHVDVSEVYTANEQLLTALNTGPIDMSKVNDAIIRRRQASDRIRGGRDAARTEARSTGDALRGFIPAAREAARSAFDAIRTATAKRDSTTAPTRDSQGELRDALHAANRATTMPAKIAALKQVNDTFWAERSYTPTATQDGHIAVRHPPQANSGPLSIADRNEINRQYWASRS